MERSTTLKNQVMSNFKTVAHNEYQFKTWKGFLDGSSKKEQINKLVASYYNELIGFCIRTGLSFWETSDKELFKKFAKQLQPPKK